MRSCMWSRCQEQLGHALQESGLEVMSTLSFTLTIGRMSRANGIHFRIWPRCQKGFEANVMSTWAMRSRMWSPSQE